MCVSGTLHNIIYKHGSIREKGWNKKHEDERHHLMKDSINHVKHWNTFNEILTIYHVARFIRIYFIFSCFSPRHAQKPSWKWKNLWEINTHYLLLTFFLSIYCLVYLIFSEKNTSFVFFSFLVIARAKKNITKSLKSVMDYGFVNNNNKIQ